MSFPLTVPSHTSRLGKDFSLQSLEVYSWIQFEIKKIGLLILLNCEAASLTVFTTMCLKEQLTSDNLIVEGYCFITEIFDKFNFSGIHEARSHDPLSRIRLLLVPKNGSCEYIKNDLPSNGSVILKNTDGNRTCSIFTRHSL